jgi:hypothetical protein
MRVQFALSFAVAVMLLIALIVFVEDHNTTASQPLVNRSAEAEQNREAEIVVGQDQAPHLARIPAGVSARVAITRAVAAYMERQFRLGTISGTLQRTACRAAGRGTRERTAFRCAAVAANVTYPFLGVVDGRARRVVYCKRDAPPVPGMNIPVSHRCV